MRRRAAGERVRPFRQRDAELEALPLREWFEALTDPMLMRLDGWYPELPAWLTDRPADVWEPLIAVADLAGGVWPARARDAAQVLVSEQANDGTSVNVRLLLEIREVFGTDNAIPTEELLERLHRLEESPWGEWSITPRWLAHHLKDFEIRSKNVRIGDKQKKGYDRECFSDAWSRYLPEGPYQASQASCQDFRGNGAVPGTDTSVPASQEQASDLPWDGKTDGTDTREAEVV